MTTLGPSHSTRWYYWTFSAGKPFKQRLWLAVINYADGRQQASTRRWQSGFWAGVALELMDAYRDRFNEDPILTSG